MTTAFKSGYATIAGAPNAGKSTLLLLAGVGMYFLMTDKGGEPGMPE